MSRFGRLFLTGFTWSCLAIVASAAPPPVSSVAYRPDGKQLAFGLGNEVVLTEVGDRVVARRSVGAGRVTAIAWNRDGTMLAVATGLPAKSGEVRLFAISPNDSRLAAPVRTIAAHADLIHALAFSPDGKTLASCSYDRLIKLWDVATGELSRTLKDHSDAVYGVAFRPDGKLLASAAADRAVKIWDPASGKRLYSLGDSTDWVYAVAWSPDGKSVAAAGVDKSIRVWHADEHEGKLLRSAFAHEKPVIKLAFTADGSTLFSLGEDRVIKSWDAAKLVERKVFPAQSETVLSFDVSPAGPQFALGRYDGVAEIVDAATGKVVAQPLPEKPKPPRLNSISLPAVSLGRKVAVVIDGENLTNLAEVTSTPKGLKLTHVQSESSKKAMLTIEAPPDLESGAYQLKLKNAVGESNGLTIYVDRFPARPEPAGTESPRTAPPIAMQSTIVGSLTRAGEVDFYRLDLKEGDEVGAHAQPSAGSKIDAVLSLEDAGGKVVAESSASVLGYRCVRSGVYVLSVRDREFRGGPEFSYRMHVGAIPVVTSYSPLGIQAGSSERVTIHGVNLGGELEVAVSAPAGAPGGRVPVPVKSALGKVLNSPSLVIGEFPQSAPGHALAVPGTGDGVIDQPGGSQTWTFHARRQQPLIVETEARRIGSPLDSVIEILDAHDQPVPLAVLRCVAKTVTVLRDHDATGSGIRMEGWNEFAMDDYVLVGSEVMRIKDLPRNPDDDCQFYSVNGRRVGYFGTTPAYHAQGSPMFRIAISPPGSTFSPNGMPLIKLNYRNDDGGPHYGKDSRLRFDPPADGEYRVRVSDARGMGGPNFGYRVTVRPPRPDFKISFNPPSPTVWKGGAIPITVTADRFDDFDGRIAIRLTDLPAGFSAPATFIEAGQNSTSFALFAEPNASTPSNESKPLRLLETASVAGQELTREATGGRPKAVDAGEIVTTSTKPVVSLRPGSETRLLVKVERRNGFKGRIPLDVLGLPHGVRVLDIGLNGILVTERDSSREIVFYAEPWVRPMEHPIVVLAKHEGKNTDHAAQSVLLKIEK
jgi:WD40 repeat protein